MDWFLYDNGLRHERINYVEEKDDFDGKDIHNKSLKARKLVFTLLCTSCIDIQSKI